MYAAPEKRQEEAIAVFKNLSGEKFNQIKTCATSKMVAQ